MGETEVEQGKEGGRGRGEGRPADRRREAKALLFRCMWPSGQKALGSNSPSLSSMESLPHRILLSR